MAQRCQRRCARAIVISVPHGTLASPFWGESEGGSHPRSGEGSNYLKARAGGQNPERAPRHEPCARMQNLHTIRHMDTIDTFSKNDDITSGHDDIDDINDMFYPARGRFVVFVP